ncbi:hypothetical protein B0H19DRAFT_1057186 [Mycena capillaripes]|nr:hypothetical protein B0H19DRAFT_1057186 [Mycena capillaripes]
MPWTLWGLFQFPPRFSLRRGRTDLVTKWQDANGLESNLLDSAESTKHNLHDDTHIPETPHTGWFLAQRDPKKIWKEILCAKDPLEGQLRAQHRTERDIAGNGAQHAQGALPDITSSVGCLWNDWYALSVKRNAEATGRDRKVCKGMAATNGSLDFEGSNEREDIQDTARAPRPFEFCVTHPGNSSTSSFRTQTQTQPHRLEYAASACARHSTKATAASVRSRTHVYAVLRAPLLCEAHRCLAPQSRLRKSLSVVLLRPCLGHFAVSRGRTNCVTKEQSASGQESDLLDIAESTEKNLRKDTYIQETLHTGRNVLKFALTTLDSVFDNIPFSSDLSSAAMQFKFWFCRIMFHLVLQPLAAQQAQTEIFAVLGIF